MDAGFKAMLTQPYTWFQRLSTDQWGNETYGDGAALFGFQTESSVALGRDDGNNRADGEKVETITLIADPDDAPFTVKDRIGKGNGTYYIDRIETVEDETGTPVVHTITATTRIEG